MFILLLYTTIPYIISTTIWSEIASVIHAATVVTMNVYFCIRIYAKLKIGIFLKGMSLSV